MKKKKRKNRGEVLSREISLTDDFSRTLQSSFVSSSRAINENLTREENCAALNSGALKMLACSLKLYSKLAFSQ